ncbi:MAG: YkgJ family cysteine cluster protein [Nanoarchaeota archaeon]|nr:YkgJ family cysteine cluster protein [Nanoarchaeota archaeon]
MKKEYFQCLPGKLCETADCCKGKETPVALTLGDYSRIKQYTSESLEEIWRKRGNVCLTPHSVFGEIMQTLGLFHNPCPYLSDEHSCSIYESRPMGCIGFPFLLLSDKSEELKTVYQSFQCLHNVKPPQDHELLAKELMILMYEEARIELSILGDPNVWTVRTDRDYFKLAADAMKVQAARDLSGQTTRSKFLTKTISQMIQLQESGELAQGIHANLFRYLLEPVIFALAEDKVAAKLAALENKVDTHFKETTERYREIKRKIK